MTARPRPRDLALPFALAALVLAGCQESPAPDDAPPLATEGSVARLVAAKEAIAGAHLPALDLHTMNRAEIRKLVGPAARCTFRYTAAGRPVAALATTADGRSVGGIKLNGSLVRLDAEEGDGRAVLEAGPIRLTLVEGGPGEAGEDDPATATAIFQVRDQLEVGYLGYLDCGE